MGSDSGRRSDSGGGGLMFGVASSWFTFGLANLGGNCPKTLSRNVSVCSRFFLHHNYFFDQVAKQALFIQGRNAEEVLRSM